MKIGKAKGGDVVRMGSGQLLVVYAEVASCVQARHVEQRGESFEVVSGPFLFDPKTEVTLVKSGAERFPKQAGGEVDPLKARES